MHRSTESQDEEISEALAALREGEHPALADDTLVCECYCVSVLDIREACAMKRQVDVEPLRQRFGLGTGCGRCVRELLTWKDKIFVK